MRGRHIQFRHIFHILCLTPLWKVCRVIRKNNLPPNILTPIDSGKAQIRSYHQ